MKKEVIYGGIGIFLGSLLAYEASLGLVFSLLVFALGLYLYLIQGLRPSFFILALGLGMGLMALKESQEPIISQDNLNMVGRIEEIIKEEDDYSSYIIKSYKLGDRPCDEKFILNINKRTRLEVGDFVRTRVSLSPLDENPNSGLFDYKTYMKIQGVETRARAGDLEALGQDQGLAMAMKRSFNRYLEENLTLGLEDNNKGFILKLVGSRPSLVKEDQEAFASLGLAHLLAVSGLHIGLIALLILGLTSLLGLPRSLGHILIIIVLSLYIWLIAYPASAMRAFVMEAALIGSVWSRRAYDRTKALFLALFLIVLVNPYRVFDMGLILSFMAVLSLGYKDKIFPTRARGPIQEGLRLSFAINLFLFPFLIENFNSFNFVSLLANVIIVPIFSLVVFASLAKFALGFVSLKFSYILGLFINQALNIIRQTNEILLGPDIFNINFKSYGPYFMVIYYGVLALYIHRYEVFRLSLYFKEKVFKSFCLGGLCLMSLYGLMDPLNVYFIAIGQGDAALFQNVSQSFMVDTGGEFIGSSSYDYILKPTLKRMADEPVEVFISHLDIDHSGNLDKMIKDGLVSRVYHSKYEDGLAYTGLEKGNVLGLGTTKVKVLYDGKDSPTSNDSSLVLLVDHHGSRILMTGDVEEVGEKALEEMGARAEILKVSHHGSKTSSSTEFLDSLRPELGIISVGKNNSYGHPHKEVLERLDQRGIKTYRTDQDGQVRLSINRFGYSFRTSLDKDYKKSYVLTGIFLTALASFFYYDFYKYAYLEGRERDLKI